MAPYNERYAYGSPREVDHEEEVVVITGGASGLGRCVAEIYALKGATVGVLDVMPVGAASAVEGVRYYECDIGDNAEIEGVWGKMTKEVCCFFPKSRPMLIIILQLGLPTVLINCAGIVQGKPMLQMSSDEVLQ